MRNGESTGPSKKENAESEKRQKLTTLDRMLGSIWFLSVLIRVHLWFQIFALMR